MSHQSDESEPNPPMSDKQPPPATESSSTRTSGNGFKTIPYIDPEELAELIAQGPTTVLYSANTKTSLPQPITDETE